jgi:hypothetical protein
MAQSDHENLLGPPIHIDDQPIVTYTESVCSDRSQAREVAIRILGNGFQLHDNPLAHRRVEPAEAGGCNLRELDSVRQSLPL